MLNHLYGEDFQYDEMMVTDRATRRGDGEDGRQQPFEAMMSLSQAKAPLKRAERRSLRRIVCRHKRQGGRIEATVTGDMDRLWLDIENDCRECTTHRPRLPDLPGRLHLHLPWVKLIERLVANAGLTFYLAANSPPNDCQQAVLGQVLGTAQHQ